MSRKKIALFVNGYCGEIAMVSCNELEAHGFGDGTGYEIAGWPERAIKFISLI